MSLLQHIRKGVSIRRNIGQINVQQLVASNFAKNQKHIKEELSLNVIYYFFFHYFCCLVVA